MYVYYPMMSSGRSLYVKNPTNNMRNEEKITGIRISEGIYFNSSTYEGKVQADSYYVYIPENHPLFNYDLAFRAQTDTKPRYTPESRAFQKVMERSVESLLDEIDKEIEQRRNKPKA